jgi:hypothetical protein
MRIQLFQKFFDNIGETDQYFLQKRDEAGRLGFFTRHKVTSALRMMAYQSSADLLDEYTQMSK